MSSSQARRTLRTLVMTRAAQESSVAHCALVGFQVCAHHKADDHTAFAVKSARLRRGNHGKNRMLLHCSSLLMALPILNNMAGSALPVMSMIVPA